MAVLFINLLWFMTGYFRKMDFFDKGWLQSIDRVDLGLVIRVATSFFSNDLG